MKFLESERLRLRAVEPADADLMCEIENDSSQWRENGMAAPYSRHNLLEYAETYDADPIRAGQIRFVCELKQPDEKSGITQHIPIGLIDLYDISPTGRTAFVGIYLFTSHRGQGIAHEALWVLEKYARLLLNLRILAAKVSGKNMASRHLFDSAGYNLCGTLPGWLLSGKEEYPLLIYTHSLESVS